ncbi:winged helix-turn-helix domain-containing protein [Streptomyces sp. JA03]|nr:winged helix-turn-helix domain-containing protein [Streptomyces barringtoniae]MCC5481142.1 winged helix-turn-helix domain-containing protein [Streptomyces barringtoniae]
MWTAARVATLIGRKFHVSYSISGATRLMRRLGFTPQMPALTDMRQALWEGFRQGVDWAAHRRALARTEFQRDLFVQKAREVLRAAPRPGAE